MYAWDFYCCLWDLAMQLLWKSSSGLWKSIPQERPEHAGVPMCISYLSIPWWYYWSGMAFSHLNWPTPSSLQSYIRLRFFYSLTVFCRGFGLSNIRLPVRFLYRCHHKSATYMWHFANLLWVITLVLTFSLYNDCRIEKYRSV